MKTITIEIDLDWMEGASTHEVMDWLHGQPGLPPLGRQWEVEAEAIRSFLCKVQSGGGVHVEE